MIQRHVLNGTTERRIYIYNECNDCIGTVDFDERQWKIIKEREADHLAALEEVVKERERKDELNYAALEAVKNERDTLTDERDALLKEIEIKGISWRASQAKVEELLISNAKRAEVIEGVREKYNDLIMEVERKYPNETRHETAKRYIREREAIADCNPKQAALEGKKEANHDPT